MTEVLEPSTTRGPARPLLQRDHAGLDVHCAAATTMYPSLAADKAPSAYLASRVAQGKLGMKTGEGFFSWTPETIAVERSRYDARLRAALELLADDLPKIEGSPNCPAPVASAEDRGPAAEQIGALP